MAVGGRDTPGRKQTRTETKKLKKKKQEKEEEDPFTYLDGYSILN